MSWLFQPLLQGAAQQLGASTPSVPTGLTLSVSSSSLLLMWGQSTGDPVGYKIYQGTTTDPTTLVATFTNTGTAYMAFDLTNGTTYYFRVKSYNGGGDSAYSANASATPIVKSVASRSVASSRSVISTTRTVIGTRTVI